MFKSKLLYVKCGDLNPIDKPMVGCDYWKWLERKGTGHRIRDKKRYLFSIGFRRVSHYLGSDDITTLRAIHSHYYWMKHKQLLGGC